MKKIFFAAFVLLMCGHVMAAEAIDGMRQVGFYKPGLAGTAEFKDGAEAGVDWIPVYAGQAGSEVMQLAGWRKVHADGLIEYREACRMAMDRAEPGWQPVFSKYSVALDLMGAANW